MKKNTIARALTAIIAIGFVAAGVFDVLQYTIVQIVLFLLFLYLIYFLFRVSGKWS